MSNPWLDVPLGEYEGHMQLPGVAQLGALAALFAEALAQTRPASVAILGIAGGNGLEHIDPAVTRRVAGVDVNPHYLEAVRRRYARLPGLELHCSDLCAEAVAMEAVELVHAALIFEHAGVGRPIDNALSLIAPGGALSVVLQLPSPSTASVSPSPYRAIQALQPHFCLIEPRQFCQMLLQRGLPLVRETTRPVAEGKALWMGLFRSSLIP